MYQRIILIIIILTALVLGAMWSARRTPSDGSFVVAGSFYPLAHFAEKAGGDRVVVRSLTPPGVEAHEYEPTPDDVAFLSDARLFVYNGGGFDPWAERLAPPLSEAGVAIFDVGEFLKSTGLFSGEFSDNPHYWVDPVLARAITEELGRVLSSRMPEHAAAIESNVARYGEELGKLHADFEKGLSRCERREAIVSHDAFAHVAARYDIRMIPILGISPEEEPSPQKLGEIASIARKRGIRYILLESGANARLGNTIAREAGLESLALNPLETLTPDELKSGEDYLSVMRKNLETLRTALTCI